MPRQSSKDGVYGSLTHLGHFARFLTLAAIEAGQPVLPSKLAGDLGLSTQLIREHYQILEDCLIADAIAPLTQTTTRRRLTKATKHLFFDLGVRRLAAKEPEALGSKRLPECFEQWVGMELLHLARAQRPLYELLYWRDHAGPEVDFVINTQHGYCPIDVKWTAHPSHQDARHLHKFLNEYPCPQGALMICQTPIPLQLSEHVRALPWQHLAHGLDGLGL